MDVCIFVWVCRFFSEHVRIICVWISWRHTNTHTHVQVILSPPHTFHQRTKMPAHSYWSSVFWETIENPCDEIGGVYRMGGKTLHERIVLLPQKMWDKIKEGSTKSNSTMHSFELDEFLLVILITLNTRTTLIIVLLFAIRRSLSLNFQAVASIFSRYTQYRSRLFADMQVQWKPCYVTLCMAFVWYIALRAMCMHVINQRIKSSARNHFLHTFWTWLLWNSNGLTWKSSMKLYETYCSSSSINIFVAFVVFLVTLAWWLFIIL